MPYVCLEPSCSTKLPGQRGQDCRIRRPESHEAQDSLQEPCQRPLLGPGASVFLTHHEVHFRCLELWVFVSSHQICFHQKKTCALEMSIFVDLELRGKKKMSPYLRWLQVVTRKPLSWKRLSLMAWCEGTFLPFLRLCVCHYVFLLYLGESGSWRLGSMEKTAKGCCSILTLWIAFLGGNIHFWKHHGATPMHVWAYWWPSLGYLGAWNFSLFLLSTW